MKPSEVLKQAKDLIKNPKNWTKVWYAKDKDDNNTEVDNPNACKFCSFGAIMKVTNIVDENMIDCKLLEYMKKCIPEKFSLDISHTLSLYTTILVLIVQL